MEKHKRENRLMALHVDEMQILECLQGRAKIVDLPSDAKFERAYYVPQMRGLCVVIASKDFAEVELGIEIPTFIAILERTTDKIKAPIDDKDYVKHRF